MKPLSKRIPSVISISSSMVRPSLTVMTPSLPTFSIACAMRLPTWVSSLAEIVATCAISAVVVIVFEWAERNSTTRSSGLRAPAEVHGVTPCCDVLDAFGVDGIGEDGVCCCAVTSYFLRFLSDTLDESRRKASAHMSSILHKRTYRAPRF